MKTLSFNIEITENDKENGDLKESFKLNAEVNFMKSILDLVKEGNDITVSRLLFSKQIIEVDEDVEVIDSDTKERKILKEKVKKNCYNCTGILKEHKYTKGQKKNIIEDIININPINTTVIKDKR